MMSEFQPGDRAKIRVRQKDGQPINWHDDGVEPATRVILEPGEEITIGERFNGLGFDDPKSRMSIHDYYWFTHPRLSRPFIIDSWRITPLDAPTPAPR